MQVAQFSAEMDRYEPAIQIYEDVAHRSMDNNLLKFSAKGYLLNAGICRLCGNSFRGPGVPLDIVSYACVLLHTFRVGILVFPLQQP